MQKDCRSNPCPAPAAIVIPFTSVAVDVLERILVQAVQAQVAVVLIPFQNALPFQKAGHPLADAVEQVIRKFQTMSLANNLLLS